MVAELRPSQLPLDAKDAIAFLVARAGNAKLAAVDASNVTKSDISESLLLAVIASDANSAQMLTQQLRLLALLQGYDAFRKAHMVFLDKLPDMSAKDIGNVYTRLFQNIGTVIGAQPTIPSDPFASIMKSLPPEVADAVEYFIKNPEAKVAPDGTKLNENEHPISIDVPDIGGTDFLQDIIDLEGVANKKPKQEDDAAREPIPFPPPRR